MLLFIPQKNKERRIRLSFNTSHVVIYRKLYNMGRKLHKGFNTSHVVIYPDLKEFCDAIDWFQYISCCYLSRLHKNNTISRKVSIHLMLLFIKENRPSCINEACFNTSHVVIYPYDSSQINCRSLFQYISCCYLSAGQHRIYAHIISFNTSHVVIYPKTNSYMSAVKAFQYISCCYLSRW